MAKRKKAEPEPGATWVVTFADLMSLLLTFFILLLSFSTLEEKKVKEALSSLKGALGVMPRNAKVQMRPTVQPQNVRRPPRAEQTESEMGKLQQQLRSRGMEKEVELAEQGKGILNIRLPASLLFRSGSAQLLESAFGVLENISILLQHYLDSYDAQFRIEGHTDDVPIGPSNFTSNWELSAARSAAVMRFLTTQMGLPEEHFGVAGYAEFKPLYRPVSLEMNRVRNRRVEIIVIPTKNVDTKPEDPSTGPKVREQQLLPQDDLPEPM